MTVQRVPSRGFFYQNIATTLPIVYLFCQKARKARAHVDRIRR